MREQEINQLNQALKGEHMAIEAFDHFILDSNDDTIKEKFQSMQQHHQKQAQELSKYIQNLGGNPVNTAGLTGVIAEVKYRISPTKYKENDLMKSVIEGEEMGYTALQSIKSKLTKFESIELIDRILNENKHILDDLKNINHLLK